MRTEAKWQRLQYMPGYGTGEEGQRITGSKEHIALSRHAAAQGMVLLKNEDHALPLHKGQRLAVFGKAQASYEKFAEAAKESAASFVDWMRKCNVYMTFAMCIMPATMLSISSSSSARIIATESGWMI